MIEGEIRETRQQLERALANKLFARSEQLSRLLRFLIEMHLEGRDGELKESVIGVEVFGRKPDYDPKSDPIVRTEVRRLRQRLSEYYQCEGIGDAVRFEVPKGGYAPAVRTSAIQIQAALPRPLVARARPHKWLWAAFWAGLACVLAMVALKQTRSLRNTTNSSAYDLYLRAHSLEGRPYLAGIEGSIDLFQQAISKDPSFAPAYAGIAAGEAARSGFDRLRSIPARGRHCTRLDLVFKRRCGWILDRPILKKRLR